MVAALLWLIAGSFVCAVGVNAASEAWTFNMAIGFLVVFALFFGMFASICRRHTKRICAYEPELMGITKVLDPPAYIILLLMVGMGASARISGLIPEYIIAFFYSGLGAALVIAAIIYIITYVAICEELTSGFDKASDFYHRFS